MQLEDLALGKARALVRWGTEPLVSSGTASELRGSRLGVCVVVGHLGPLKDMVGDPEHGGKVCCAACGSGKAVGLKKYDYDGMKLLPGLAGTLVVISGKYICTGCPKGAREAQGHMLPPCMCRRCRCLSGTPVRADAAALLSAPCLLCCHASADGSKNTQFVLYGEQLPGDVAPGGAGRGGGLRGGAPLPAHWARGDELGYGELCDAKV